MPVSNAVLNKNIQATLEDILVQIGHANDVNGRARTGYYKTSVLLAASVVEALLYHLLEKECTANPSLYGQVKSLTHKQRLELNKTTFSTTKTFWICEVIEVNFVLRKANFQAMNKFAKQTNIISPRLFNSLEFVRETRNKIHLQSLSSSSRQFNARTVDRIARVMDQVYNKI